MAEAVVPGLAPSPPLLLPKTALNRLFHFTFNRLDALNEQLVEGREHLFLGHQFATKAARPLPQHAVDYYIRTLAGDRNALWACFEPYRAIDTTIEQNEQRRHQPLAMPVLAIAGAKSMAESVVTSLAPVCEDLASVILAGCGHYLAEEAPEEMLTALTEFLAPYAGEAQPAPY
jgi:pimeloyl-ACP methyl ester carboxylesterase